MCLLHRPMDPNIAYGIDSGCNHRAKNPGASARAELQEFLDNERVCCTVG